MNKKSIIVIFSVLVSFAFLSCSNDNEDDTKVDAYTGSTNTATKTASFIGIVNVDNGYIQNDVLTSFVLNSVYNKASITMNNVRFSQQMPVYINMELKDMTYVIKDNDTIYARDSIVPYVMGGEVEKFTMKNFYAIVTRDSLNIETQCGQYNIRYSAKRNK